MKYNDLINDLLDLLDENENIREIKKIKKSIALDNNLKNDLENYRLLRTVDAKKKLYVYPNYVKYLECENQIRFLIQDIKNKFIIFNNKRCYHENN